MKGYGDESKKDRQNGPRVARPGSLQDGTSFHWKAVEIPLWFKLTMFSLSSIPNRTRTFESLSSLKNSLLNFLSCQRTVGIPIYLRPCDTFFMKKLNCWSDRTNLVESFLVQTLGKSFFLELPPNKIYTSIEMNKAKSINLHATLVFIVLIYIGTFMGTLNSDWKHTVEQTVWFFLGHVKGQRSNYLAIRPQWAHVWIQ